MDLANAPKKRGPYNKAMARMWKFVSVVMLGIVAGFLSSALLRGLKAATFMVGNDETPIVTLSKIDRPIAYWTVATVLGLLAAAAAAFALPLLFDFSN